MSDNLQLESLPNEIFIEIFDYFSLAELYQSFKDLNQRINNILQSLTNRALQLWSSSEYAEHEMNEFFSPTIVSLIINDEYDVHLNHYPQIHSLTYIYATNCQLEHFLQSNFCHSNFKYLNVTSDDLVLFIDYIHSHQFSSLRQCILRNIDSLSMCPWKMTPTSRSISICADENLISTILQSCPNLTHLSLSIFRYSHTTLLTILVHRYLKYLSIEMIEPAWTVEMIERLFSSIQISQLISFQIQSHESSIIPFDFNELLTIFNTHLPNLQRFDCNISIPSGIDIKSIRELHPFLFNSIEFRYQHDGSFRIYTRLCEN